VGSTKLDQIKIQAEGSFVKFVRLVAPHLLLGLIHVDLMEWLTRQDAKPNRLVLLPRGHMKSKLAAYYTAWKITKNPAITVLYISATSPLAEKQLYQIKLILDSEIYQRYWPEMLNNEEGKREKWAVEEICVDHPIRKREGVRDSTVKAAGITANVTGFHADLVVLDDLVVPNNAYTEDGRDRVEALYSQLASVENPNAEEVAVGTRYDPRDIYNQFVTMQVTVYDDEGNEADTDNVYEVFEKEVEIEGEFLWPRQQRKDGQWFGFDRKILAGIKAKYLITDHFYAQYYNNPNAVGSGGIDPNKFQYYEPRLLTKNSEHWFFGKEKLAVTAAIDFAFSLKKKADYTALVTVGTSASGNYYVLDIDRFKTDRIVEYFNHIVKAQNKWGFRKICAEVTVAQQQIVNELKESYIKPNGLPLIVDEYRPSRHEGDKEERVAAILEPKYENQAIWHYKAGNCQVLEEELILKRPPHDDVKEALSNAIKIAVIPRQWVYSSPDISDLKVHPRFGGVM
tara:strand:- start:3729 stop:5261 length:1533 start_codon:yes stop_codon:yes gene_type:complete